MIVNVDAKDRSNRESHFLKSCRFWMELGALNWEGLWIRLDLHRMVRSVFYFDIYLPHHILQLKILLYGGRMASFIRFLLKGFSC